jgi:hypothetical protein
MTDNPPEDQTESQMEKYVSVSSMSDHEYGEFEEDDGNDEFFDALEDAFSMLIVSDSKQLQQQLSNDSESDKRLNSGLENGNANSNGVDDDVDLETDWCFWFDR